MHPGASRGMDDEIRPRGRARRDDSPEPHLPDGVPCGDRDSPGASRATAGVWACGAGRPEPGRAGRDRAHSAAAGAGCRRHGPGTALTDATGAGDAAGRGIPDEPSASHSAIHSATPLPLGVFVYELHRRLRVAPKTPLSASSAPTAIRGASGLPSRSIPLAAASSSYSRPQHPLRAHHRSTWSRWPTPSRSWCHCPRD